MDMLSPYHPANLLLFTSINCLLTIFTFIYKRLPFESPERCPKTSEAELNTFPTDFYFVSLCFLSVASEISDQDLDLQSWCSLWLFLVLSPSCWIKSLALLCPKKSLAFALRLCEIICHNWYECFCSEWGGGGGTPCILNWRLATPKGQPKF